MYFDRMPHVDAVEHVYPLVDGIRVHCAVAGEGPPLVLLHGWPQHWWSWREIIGPLAERFRVVCPDIRGMGWTDAPRAGYHLRTLTRDLLALLTVLASNAGGSVGTAGGFLSGNSACFPGPNGTKAFPPMAGITP